MQCLVERDPLLTVVAAAAKLTVVNTYEPLTEQVVLRHQDGLLRVSATNTVTNMDCYLPAEFTDAEQQIITKKKEWAYLLKNAASPLLTLLSDAQAKGQGRTAAVVLADGTACPFPNEQYANWKDHQLVPAEVMATIRIDALERALEMTNEFQSHKSTVRCYGTLLESGQTGLRFVSTNAHCMAMLDVQVGLYSMPSKQKVYVEEPAFQLMRACLKLWEGVDPAEVDCEIRVVHRKCIPNADGETFDLEPVVIFDLSGCGYRVLITTIAQGPFANYEYILRSAGEQGVIVAAERLQVLALCEQANQQDTKKAGKLVFKFQQGRTANCRGVNMWVGYPLNRKGLPEGCAYTRQDIVPCCLASETKQVKGGIPDVTEEDRKEGLAERIVSISAKYLGNMLKHADDHRIVMRFHGVLDAVEVEGENRNTDPWYFIFMPIYQTVQEDAL